MSDFGPSNKINFRYAELKKGFIHNLEADYQIFILWENSRPYEREILKLLEKDFEVLSKHEILWSKRHADNNFKRLYKNIDKEIISKKSEHVGCGEFLVVIIRDKEPLYTYRKTVSGTIELVNRRTIKIKREVRNLCGDTYVHSTASPKEFYEQAVLIFGVERLYDILKGKDENNSTLTKDLEGADGWKDFRELFSVLEFCSRYVVLRNFEFLPDDFFKNDKDVDILCDSVADFISASNANLQKLTRGGAKVEVNISGRFVPFDIRFVGDGYYDEKWEYDILERREKNKNNIFQPRIDDYYFSLLYHAALQKSAMDAKYINVLNEIADNLDFDFVTKSTFKSVKEVAEILDGFMRYHGYSYVTPKDENVFVNFRVLRHISKDLGGRRTDWLIEAIRALVPENIKKLIPVSVKQKILGYLK